jgi:hypothetical protein
MYNSTGKNQQSFLDQRLGPEISWPKLTKQPTQTDFQQLSKKDGPSKQKGKTKTILQGTLRVSIGFLSVNINKRAMMALKSLTCI